MLGLKHVFGTLQTHPLRSTPQMVRLQFKLRTLFAVMTLIAVACVIVPTAPLAVSRFLADSRHMLVAAALAMFVTTIVCYRSSRRIDAGKGDTLKSPP